MITNPATGQPYFMVGITGHRPDKLGGYGPNPIMMNVIYNLTHIFGQLKPDYVLTGMALGVDQWAAEICISKGIPFVAVIPFEGQESRWPSSSQQRYHNILAHACQTIIVCDGGYESWKLHARNRWIVDHCQKLVAVYNGSGGGTASCVAYAQQVGRPIEYLVPNAVPYPTTSDPVVVTKIIKEQVEIQKEVNKIVQPEGATRYLDWGDK